jgi:hypothetical protein
MRLSLALPLALGLLACRMPMPPGPVITPWPAWERSVAIAHWRGAIDAADQVVEHRESWRGAADLSAEFLLIQESSALTLLVELVDDRPLQQSRPERVHPGWWLMRMGGDAIGLTLSPQGAQDPMEILVALGSAGTDPQILDGEPSDRVEVWPTVRGARIRLTLDLANRGEAFANLSLDGAEVTVYDTDGPADWSVHRTPLR